MKKIKQILALAVLIISANACIDDDVTSFQESPYVVGFETAVANESYFEDQGAILANYPLNVLGGKDGSPILQDITVNYEISAASTAMEGREFDFVDNSGSLTIPSGSTFVNFPLNINTGGFDPNTPTTLILTLTGASGGESVISSLDDQLTVTFVGCQSGVDEFTYMVTTRTAAGGLENEQMETITMESVNVFRTQTVGPFGIGARRGSIGGTEGFTFNDVCGDITISTQGLVSLYSNEVVGSGSVDPETGNITFSYSIDFGGTPTFYISTFIKQ